jgi:hypothetical protein
MTANVPIVPNVPGASVPIGASVLDAGTTGGEAAAKQFSVNTALWGRCRVVPRDSEPDEAVTMGYVSLEGEPDSLKLAIWKGGKWLDWRMKDFPVPVVRSYSVEKADGTPVF